MCRLLEGNAVPAMVAWAAATIIILLSAIVLWMTFIPGIIGEPGFTLDNYKEAWSDLDIREVVINTIMVGVGTVLVTFFFAIPMAWLIQRTDMPLKALVMTFIALGALIPGFLKAIGWIILLSEEIGIINVFLKDLFGLKESPFNIEAIWGIAFVQGLMLTPTMFFLVSGPMRSLDPSLEEAAEVAGANKLTTILRVSFPLVWPAALGGAIYTFMTAISIFEVAALIGGGRIDVVATELFYSVTPEAGLPRYGIAAVLGLTMIAPSLLALFYYFRTIERAHRYQVVTGKGYRPKLFNMGPWKYLAFGFTLLYIALAVGFPFLVLLWTSLLPSIKLPSAEAFSQISFEQYSRAWAVLGGLPVFLNTILLVVGVAVIGLFISFMVSWIAVRTKMRGRRAIDVIAMLPHAIPGLAFAFALAVFGMLTSRWLWFPFYGTIGIIIAANVINRLSWLTRVTNAALLQVHVELEEAAMICGARKLKTIWYIMVPLIRPSLLFAGLWSGMLALREVTMALMLLSGNNEVVATRIWLQWAGGYSSAAASLGVLLILVMAAVVFLLQRTVGIKI
jgi:iron(III) transport system permease protein